MGGQIRGAVIGYGGAFDMGRHHGTWMERAGIKLATACDLDEERCKVAEKEFLGIKTFTDYRKMLAETDVDLVTVILPHNLHAEAAIACSEAGKHVVVEKPMCLNVAEADAMIAAAEKAGRMLSVFHNRRHDGDFRAIKETIEKGTIGDVFHIECSVGGFERPGDWWRSDKTVSGGNLYDWGAHFFDWILNLVPSEVESVMGCYQDGVWTGCTNEDHTQAILRFKNGCIADVQVSQLDSVPKPKWRILGTKGGILADWGQNITVTTASNGQLESNEVRCAEDDWGAYYSNVAAHLVDGEPLAVTAEQGRRTIAIIEAAEMSNASRQAERPQYE